jgi:hypothetical protein
MISSHCASTAARTIGAMRITYGEFEIEADRHGSYSIKLNGKLVRRVTAVTDYPGKPRWGSRKLEADAIADARRDIEAFLASSGLHFPTRAA